MRRKKSWSSRVLDSLYWLFTGIFLRLAAGLLWLWELPSRRKARGARGKADPKSKQDPPVPL